MTTPAIAAIYVRISDDREGRELGVDRQEKECQALARRENLQVAEVYRENNRSASANASKPRPEFMRLVEDVKSGRISVIIAYSSSRLTRQMREHEDLIDLATKYGVTYRFVQSPSFNLNTADGQQIARILAANDAAEAARIKERVKAEVKDRARRGEFHGGPRPFGITADGTQLVDAEAELIRKWYAHVLAGGSLSSIRTDLNRDGVPSVNGKEWRTPVIRRILLHPRNAGLRILDGIELPAPNPEIVPEQTWRAAHRLLADPDRTVHKLGPALKHLGTGLFVCERCDTTVNAAYDMRGNLIYKCLRCYRSWRAELLNKFIDDVIEGKLSAEDARQRLLPKRVKDVDVAALRTERAAIRANLDDTAEQFMLSRGATRDALERAISKAEKRLEEIDAEVAEAGRIDVAAALLAADDPAQAYRDIEDVSRRQAVIRLMMAVRLGAPIRGRAKWDERKFMGASQWAGDARTWGELWSDDTPWP